MKSLAEKTQALALKEDGLSYSQIAKIMKITRNSAISLCRYVKKDICKKRGPKFTISKGEKLLMKRMIGKLKERKSKVNAKKLKIECDLNISVSTIQRHMKRSGMRYKKIQSMIYLSQKHKEGRLLKVSTWVSENHVWEKTVFSDEKRFSLDGPDDWRTYISKNEHISRQRRQCRGGGIMVWMMALPNGLLSYNVVKGKFNSEAYIALLRTSTVPILKLNLGTDFWLQEDNSPVHKSAKVKEFMKSSGIKILSWPAKSPDLNIAEDIWKLISDQVYDGPQFQNINELTAKLKHVVHDINQSQRTKITDLYKSYRRRLCTVLLKRGSLCNK